MTKEKDRTERKEKSKCKTCNRTIDLQQIRCDHCQSAYLEGVGDGEKSIKSRFSDFLREMSS
jgi:primosomal protein N'